MMTYPEVLNFLYQQLPVFHREGKKAFKPGLEHIQHLCDYFGYPEKRLKCFHIAGTNGKGSSSHLLASILQSHGYRVGLYTSPHLKNFTERFKLNGEEIPEKWITDFVNTHQEKIQNFQASFFEWTVIMAFLYFAEQQVDFVVIETGLGGRLDSTNIILPLACLITNISFDHQDILGNTLEEIASEKSGIIKKETPVTISEFQIETADVFVNKAKEQDAPIQFASKEIGINKKSIQNGFQEFEIQSQVWKEFVVQSPLIGNYQLHNIRGIIAFCEQLQSHQIISLKLEKIIEGIHQVIQQTNLKGRFQTIHGENPKIIVDTAHNEAGIKSVLEQIISQNQKPLTLIIGMVKDKDIQKVLALLPNDAHYLFTEISNPRKLPKEELKKLALDSGKNGRLVQDVNAAIEFAKEKLQDHLVIVIGSTYLVAEINEL